MARGIGPGLHWIQECDSDRHVGLAFEGFPPADAAPIHGYPILGVDVEGYLDRVIAAAERIVAANAPAESGPRVARHPPAPTYRGLLWRR